MLRSGEPAEHLPVSRLPATVMIPTVPQTALKHIVGPLAMSFNQWFRQK
ncbi:hypothetical protein [Bradyrhizobium sp. WSM1743]|nr:hypothetical protein [Bradyrhizobium sp. WSM1743]